jgi:hypothetical protein
LAEAALVALLFGSERPSRRRPRDTHPPTLRASLSCLFCGERAPQQRPQQTTPPSRSLKLRHSMMPPSLQSDRLKQARDLGSPRFQLESGRSRGLALSLHFRCGFPSAGTVLNFCVVAPTSGRPPPKRPQDEPPGAVSFPFRRPKSA